MDKILIKQTLKQLAVEICPNIILSTPPPHNATITGPSSASGYLNSLRTSNLIARYGIAIGLALGDESIDYGTKGNGSSRLRDSKLILQYELRRMVKDGLEYGLVFGLKKDYNHTQVKLKADSFRQIYDECQNIAAIMQQRDEAYLSMVEEKFQGTLESNLAILYSDLISDGNQRIYVHTDGVDGRKIKTDIRNDLSCLV